MYFTSNKRQHLVFLLSLVAGFLAFYFRWKALGQTEYVNGWDGYFYLIQLRAWIETGAMHSPDASLIYPFMGSLYLFIEDYVLAYKMTAAILSSAFVLLIFAVARRWGASFYLAGLLASISLFSPQLTYFAAQYPKNLLGMTLLLGFFWSVGHQWKILPLLFLLLNYFGHRLSFGLALIFIIVYFLSQRFTWRQLAWASFVLLCIVSLGLLLPGLLHWTDFERLEGLLSKMPHFSPYSFVQEFGKERLTMLWGMEIGMSCVVFFGALFFLFQKKKDARFLGLLAICTFLVFPFFKWSLTSFSYRFFLVFVLLAPCLSIFYFPQGKRWNKVYGMLILILVGMSGYSYQAYQPQLHDPHYKRYAGITKKAMEVLEKGQTELVIAHPALAEFFTFTTQIDAMPWLPEYEIADRKLWRIAAGVRAPLLAYYLTEEEKTSTFRLALRYYLIREATWQKMLATIKEEDLASYQELSGWKNPNRIRPSFLLRKKQ
ncbi:MAG: hypothetical protein AB8G15_21615 [Saprospiraceae bacterium]